MSIVRWNPWREFDDLFTRVGGLPSEGLSSSEWLPAVDISETDSAYRIDVEVPAVPAENIDVSVKDGVLTVTGERRYEKEENGKQHRVERRYGRFARSFRLPEDVEEDSIDAQSRDGVLTLTISKREKETPRRIEVKVH